MTRNLGIHNVHFWLRDNPICKIYEKKKEILTLEIKTKKSLYMCKMFAVLLQKTLQSLCHQFVHHYGFFHSNRFLLLFNTYKLC